MDDDFETLLAAVNSARIAFSMHFDSDPLVKFIFFAYVGSLFALGKT